MESVPAWPFENTYARLPDRFFQRTEPQTVPEPSLIRVNQPLAERLGLDPGVLSSPEGLLILSGNRVPPGAEPLAAVYAGHQFGHFNPQLGDGRALLLGELVATDGERFDIQLKGSGRTRYSRGGDGKSPLGPVLREYIVSEAMSALGVPTTRSLAAVATGEWVLREAPKPGAVLTRVARSHIRIGTFEYFAAQKDIEALRILMRHVLDRHYPDLVEAEKPALSLLEAVVERQAALIAKWQLIGFIHGVMNTDNMLLSGESIDYGPCAFIDGYHPDTVYSSIDRAGRYAYKNQPSIAQWNLAALASALLPIIDEDLEAGKEQAQAAINRFPEAFYHYHHRGLLEKLALSEANEENLSLAQDLMTVMSEHQLDFTLTFRRLAELAGPKRFPTSVEGMISLPSELGPWLTRWKDRLSRDPQPLESRAEKLRLANPVYIPRNHLVEEAIRAAEDEGDYSSFHQLVEVVESPFELRDDRARFALPPEPHEVVQQTFCGT